MKIDYVNFLNYAGVHFKPDNGRQLNFLDYSQYFSQFPNINNILIYTPTPNFTKNYTDFLSNNTISKLRNINKTSIKLKEISHFNNPGEILICDFYVFGVLVSNDIPIDKYLKIFIFDCLELTLFFKNVNSKQYINTYKRLNYSKINRFISKNNPTFLLTDYNINMKPNVNYIRYFKKINFNIFNNNYINSFDRCKSLVYYCAVQNTKSDEYNLFIKTIKEKYPNIIITNRYLDIWKYDTILYTQKPYVQYIEQFGRMVFELKYFNYNVIIDDMFKKEDKTGLDYYLEYYKNHDINLHNEDFRKIINEF